MIRNIEQNLMIKESLELFMQEKYAAGLSPASLGMNEECVAYFLKLSKLCDSDYISVITQQLFTEFVIAMKERGLSLGTINKTISHVRTFLYWCMNNNYMESFKIRLVKGQEPKIKFIPDDEVEKLLVRPNKDCAYWESRTYVIICFLLSCGCRASTLINITFDDIDMKNRTITYSHLKNKKIATVPMSDALYKVLNDYIREWKRTKYNYLFCNSNEEQLTVGALEKSIAKYCKKRGCQRHGPHSFRHTFARMYIRNGGNAFSLQQFLTHSSIDVTKKYVELFSDDLRINLDKYCPLDNLMKSGNRTLTIRRV